MCLVKNLPNHEWMDPICKEAFTLKPSRKHHTLYQTSLQNWTPSKLHAAVVENRKWYMYDNI